MVLKVIINITLRLFGRAAAPTTAAAYKQCRTESPVVLDHTGNDGKKISGAWVLSRQLPHS